MPVIERILVALDRPALAAAFRIVAGLMVVPVWLQLGGGRLSGWTLFLFFIGALAALRVVPAVLRKLFRVSSARAGIWAERRRVAKRFDSYQWRKLLWMGLGLAVYWMAAEMPSRAVAVLMWLTISSGALGQLVWRYRAARLPPAPPPRPSGLTPTHGLIVPETGGRRETGIEAGSNA
jgi:hypothetical protein